MKAIKEHYGVEKSADLSAHAHLQTQDPWRSAAVLDAVPAYILLLDREGRLLTANDAWRQSASTHALLDCNCDIGADYLHRCARLAHGDATEVDAVIAGIRSVLDGSAARFSFEYADTSIMGPRWFIAIATPMGGDLSNGATVMHVDVTQQRLEHDALRHCRREVELRVEYLNRVSAMLSGMNTLIVRVRDRGELFREACRIAVTEGGFRLAIIATLDAGGRTITPVAHAADDEEMLAAVMTILAARGGALTAISEAAITGGVGIASNDCKMDRNIPSRLALAKFGIRSLAVFPLIIAGSVVGVVGFHARERHFFHSEEMKLLGGVTDDIAFAADYIQKQDRLNYLALYDPLTGLANRTLFLERVARHMRTAAHGGHKLALILIDVDRFKNVNASLGRAAGDLLIRSVSLWLSANVGDSSHMARLDADKFAIVLPEVAGAGEVTHLLEKTLGQFASHPFELSAVALRVAAKAGIAIFEDGGEDVETLFIHAEAALKKAKAGGHRYLVHTQRMTEPVAQRLSVENRLRQALEKNQFVLHYQPKMDLLNRQITGVEALIRWNDPETGTVQPKDFVPLLEEAGLIHAVGLWALETAMADFLRWHRRGFKAPRIAVNVSPLQLRDPDFVTHIARVVGIDPAAAAGLELELTESVIMEDVEHSRVSLQAIRALGVKIAIDDFGTGFSSLSYLVKLPVHTVKIDRSFIVELAKGQEGIVLNTMIINLAHSLALNVVGEGVETPEQEQALRALGCDEIQGYYFSEPLPVDVLESRFLQAAVTRSATVTLSA